MGWQCEGAVQMEGSTWNKLEVQGEEAGRREKGRAWREQQKWVNNTAGRGEC